MSETLHPSALPMYIRSAILGTVISGMAVFLTNFVQYEPTGIMLAVWTIAFIASITAWVSHQFISIEASDTEITYKSGVINTRIMVIPYGQITNLNIKRTLAGRILGLGTLDIDTASGTVASDIEVGNLPYAGLEKLLEKSRGKFAVKKTG